MNRMIVAVLALTAATPVAAQMDMSMPGMTMPVAPAPRPKPAAAAASPTTTTDVTTSPPATPPVAEQTIGAVPAPAPPADHAADKLFDTRTMDESRAALRHENGAMTTSSVFFNLAEYRVQKGADAFRWDGEGWFGGDINRLVIKTEGEATVGKRLDSAEAQAVFSHAISPYFNVQAGIRHDIRPGPNRTYATLGFEGLAPYWFDLSGALFVSERGAVLARLEGTYDQRLTQRVILQPRVELNLAAQDVAENGIGAGLSDAELGLRLRYEITRQFAPYVGVSWESKAGATARFARGAGERVHATSTVFGIRTRF